MNQTGSVGTQSPNYFKSMVDVLLYLGIVMGVGLAFAAIAVALLLLWIF